MKKTILTIFAIFPLLCMATSQKTITMDKYYDVQMGSSEQSLKKNLGKPYAVCQLSHDEAEYEYIERLSTGTDVLEERHYFFRIKNGRVKSSRMTTKVIPFYQRNSYDLQTSFNESFKDTPNKRK